MQNSDAKRLSFSVSYILFIIGLVIEFVILLPIVSSASNLTGMPLVIINVCMVLMLIHQFITMVAFHKIDHLSQEELVKSGFGNWVYKNFFEKFLRVLVFVLFGCLSGEVVYLFIILGKISQRFGIAPTYLDTNYGFFIDSLHSQIVIDSMFFTESYLTFALLMSLVISIWSLLGIIVDRFFSSDRRIKATLTTKYISVAPFSHPYFAFFATDLFGFFMWLFLKRLVVSQDSSANWFLGFFALGYMAMVISRISNPLRGKIMEYLANKRPPPT